MINKDVVLHIEIMTSQNLSCLSCGSERVIEKHKFCGNCGKPYRDYKERIIAQNQIPERLHVLIAGLLYLGLSLLAILIVFNIISLFVGFGGVLVLGPSTIIYVFFLLSFAFGLKRGYPLARAGTIVLTSTLFYELLNRILTSSDIIMITRIFSFLVVVGLTIFVVYTLILDIEVNDFFRVNFY